MVATIVVCPRRGDALPAAALPALRAASAVLTVPGLAAGAAAGADDWDGTDPASLPEDTGVVEERRLAETTAAEEALDALAEVARDLEVDQEVEDRAREEQEAHLRVVEAGDVSAEDDDDVRRDQQYRELRLELLHRKRGTVVRLRDEGRIDDTVLRQVQARLDAEEVRLAPGELSD